MEVFYWVVLIGAICGLCMVVGSLLLLWKGAVNLQRASAEEAITVEFKNLIRVSSHYPALGLFIIGLTFIVVSMHFSQPDDVRSITLDGSLVTSDGSRPQGVTIYVTPSPWRLQAHSDGKITGWIHLDTDLLFIKVVAPGYSDQDYNTYVNLKEIKGNTAFFGEIDLGKRTHDLDSVGILKIEKANEELAPLLTGAGSFSSGRY